MNKATIKFVDNMSFTGQIDNNPTIIPLDAGEESGGSDNGFRPKPLLLVALGGCTGMDVASLIKKMRLDIETFDIQVEADKSEQMPVIFTDIRVIYRFKAKSTEIKEKLTKIVEMSQQKYCGVAAMLNKAAKLTYTIYLNDEKISD